MRKFIQLIILLLFYFTGIHSYAQEKNTESFSFKWDKGFKLESPDKKFKLKFGGRIMYDIGFFDINDEAKANDFPLLSENGNEFRRARMFTSGTIYDNISFKLQVDFAGGNVVLKDAYINIGDIPFFGNISAGHFVDPIVFESFTSSKYMTFIERSVTTNVVSGRNSGFMIFNSFDNSRMSYQFGFFSGKQKATSDNPIANGDYNITSRIARTLFKNENNSFHLGFSHSFRKPQKDKTFGFSVRPETHIASNYLVVNMSEVKSINAFNIETAVVLNSFSIQSEYLHTGVKQAVKTTNFNSFYTNLSYFLTGEKRAYHSALLGFGRVTPKSNFGSGGTGAFEIALRYSTINGLEDDDMNNITAGLNWHLNPSTRIMLNYTNSNINNETQFSGKGRFNAIQMRFQLDF